MSLVSGFLVETRDGKFLVSEFTYEVIEYRSSGLWFVPYIKNGVWYRCLHDMKLNKIATNDEETQKFWNMLLTTENIDVLSNGPDLKNIFPCLTTFEKFPSHYILTCQDDDSKHIDYDFKRFGLYPSEY